MCEDDFDEFVRLLDDAYVFQKDKLTVQAKMVFFRAMARYPLDVIRFAMSAHMTDPKVGKWAMQPADLIAQIQGAAVGDGRPGAEEAWAIALTSRDESQTVVWTQEIAEAFAACRPVLEASNAISARMSFVEAYTRLVAAARTNGVPAQWSASLGWDLQLRGAVLKKAASAGLLPAPVVAGLLPPPDGTEAGDSNAKAQISKIKQMLATMNAEKQREAELHAQRKRDEDVARKQEIAQQVADYRDAIEPRTDEAA